MAGREKTPCRLSFHNFISINLFSVKYVDRVFGGMFVLRMCQC